VKYDKGKRMFITECRPTYELFNLIHTVQEKVAYQHFPVNRK
jgi:hypothetical protein